MVKKFYKNKRKTGISLFYFFLIPLFLYFFPFSLKAQVNGPLEKAAVFFENKYFYEVITLLAPYNNTPFYSQNDQYHYMLGISYFFIKQYDKSLENLNKIKESYYGYIFDYKEYYKGFIYFVRNDYQNCAENFNSIAKYEENISELGMYYYYFAIALMQLEEYDLALYYLEKGLNSEQEDYKPYYSFTLGRLYFNLKLYDKAEIEFRRFLLKYSSSDLMDDTLYYLGKSYYKQNKAKQAKDEFILLVNNYPNSEYYYYSYYYLGRITGNKIYYEYIVKNKPDFEKLDYVFYFLGKLSLDEKELARIYFENSLDITKDPGLAYNCLVFLLQSYKEDPENMLKTIIHSISKVNNQEQFLIIALNTLYNEKLLEYFDDILSLNLIQKSEKHPQIQFVLGKIYILQKDYDNAIRAFTNSLSNQPGDYKTLYYLGYLYFQKSDLNNSFAYLKKSDQINQTNDIYKQLARKFIGFYYYEKNDLLSAYNTFNQFLRQYPGSELYYEILYYYSIISFNLKYYNQAALSIKKCINSIDHKSDLYIKSVVAGIKILRKTSLEDAAQLYKTTGYLYDNDYSLAFLLSDAYFNIQKYSLSDSYLDIPYNSDNIKAKIDAGLKKYLIAYNIKEYDSAYSVLKSIASLDTDYKKSFIYAYLVEISYITEPAQAEKYYEILKKYNDLSLIYNSAFFLFSSYYKDRDFESALKYIDQALIFIPDNVKPDKLFFLKGSLLYEMNRLTEALEIFESMRDKKLGDLISVNNMLFQIYLKTNNTEKLKTSAYTDFMENQDEKSLYNSLVYLILFKEFDKIDDQELKTIILKAKSVQNPIIKLLGEYMDQFYFSNDFDMFKNKYKKYISDKNDQIAFWTRYFFALYYEQNNDYKNAYKILETVYSFGGYPEIQLIIYRLALYENRKYVKGSKYWDLFVRDYKDSLIYFLSLSLFS